jgi:hypothetical protein
MFATQGYTWVLEGDITACFDEIDHTALMNRVRRRVGDKRVVGLVKAFLHAGVLSEDGVTRDTKGGTPQGGILSPLLANIALSVLDEHCVEAWERDMATRTQRITRRSHGEATYRLVRYADLCRYRHKGQRALVVFVWRRVWRSRESTPQDALGQVQGALRLGRVRATRCRLECCVYLPPRGRLRSARRDH